MYALERRTQSPAARALKQAFRQRIRRLTEMQRLWKKPLPTPK
jgi:hypothetical protein